ncbi:MAG: hypothetical protein L6Q69_17820 [Zoogloea sp.]|nr:hypothetical protein [Zoogloea sp.]
MMENEEAVLRQRFLDFEEIYGSNWEESQRDLYKYFAKSFGCRLVDATTNVPPDIVECIVRNSFCTHLCLTLAVNEDTLLLPSRHRNGFIGKGKLFSWTPRSAPRSDDIFTWDEHVSWLTTCYWYNNAPDDACGSSWIADRKLIHLGSFAPLNKRERNELIKKTRDYK